MECNFQSWLSQENTCLRASLSHKLEYWLGLLYPSQAEEAAREVDQLYREVMENVVVW